MRNLVISLAAVAALSAFAAPTPAAAQAQQSAMLAAPQEQDAAGSAPGTSRPRAAAQSGDRVVCMRINPGASRITRRVCRTRREWEERGGDEVVDPR